MEFTGKHFGILGATAGALFTAWLVASEISNRREARKIDRYVVNRRKAMRDRFPMASGFYKMKG
jgi:hypothetical protein